jgi:riboflavin kinase / FMN adenylyltransferase
MTLASTPSFTARVVTGDGRGTALGRPTLNLELSDLPGTLEDGVYACWAAIDEEPLAAVFHVGLRPTFNRPKSAEVHLLDRTQASMVTHVTVQLVERLRSVQAFATPDALLAQIATDISRARATLQAT